MFYTTIFCLRKSWVSPGREAGSYHVILLCHCDVIGWNNRPMAGEQQSHYLCINWLFFSTGSRQISSFHGLSMRNVRIQEIYVNIPVYLRMREGNMRSACRSIYRKSDCLVLVARRGGRAHVHLSSAWVREGPFPPLYVDVRDGFIPGINIPVE